MASVEAEPQNSEIPEEDLEDGEIETDDDDEPILIKDDSSSKTDNIIVPMPKILTPTTNNTISPVKNEIPIINLIDNDVVISSPSKKSSKSKFKRPQVVDDDFAGNIENAIAAALKKDGIEPPLPKLLDKRSRQDDKTDNNQSGSSSKRRNRKKKKRKAEQETNEINTKKKPRNDDSTEQQKSLKDPDDDISDALMYEMLGIRGGSPPPGSTERTFPKLPPLTTYFSDDSYGSYSSYDSSTEYRNKSERNRSRKDRKERKGRSSREKDRKGRDHDSSRRDRKNRNNDREENDEPKGLCIAYLRGQCFDDDCPRPHEGRPERKLELCKFYLKECCAKKDKCLYMHSDFPCKYYYLGMDCIYKKECKYMHGEPLNEALRSILLKHIETAPKEILGTFRRISRDHALQLLYKTHGILCKKYNKENTLPQIAIKSSSTSSINGSSNNNNNINNNNNNSQSLLANPATFNALVESNITSVPCPTSTGIPSLLDMVINPPALSSQSSFQGKQRKSRWASDIKIQMQQQQQQHNKTLDESGHDSLDKEIPGFLNLKCLDGILRPEQINMLLDLGVETLQQLSSLSLLQLSQVGLTITQVNELQLNAMNLEKLGIFKMSAISGPKINVPLRSTQTSLQANQTFGGYMKENIKEKSPFRDGMKSLTSDIDMRVLPSTGKNDKTLEQAGIASPEPQPNIGMGKSMHNEPTSSNSNAVDYSQYLKDSNIEDDKMDLNLDDEQQLVIEDDEDELRIDESACDSDEEKGNNSGDDGNGDRLTPIGETTFDDESNSSSRYLPPAIPSVFDSKNLNSKKVIDLSSTVSSMLAAQAAAAAENITKPKALTVVPPSQQHQQQQQQQQESPQPSSSISFFQKRSDQDDRNKINIDLIDQEIDKQIRAQKAASSSMTSNANTVTSNLKVIDNFYGTSTNKEKSSTTTDIRDPRFSRTNSKSDTSNTTKLGSFNDIMAKHSFNRSPSPIKSPQHREPTVYERPSIYDGNVVDDDNDNLNTPTKKADKDMRMVDFIDSNNSDIDLRLPFKPVMTNFTPATEIDGSLSSHNPFSYKVTEIDIPKPEYREIRRNFPLNEKTLDPRLRRIFCLRETTSTTPISSAAAHKSHPIKRLSHDSDSESSYTIGSSSRKYDTNPSSSSTTNSSNLRLDPRKRKIQNPLSSPIDSLTSTIPPASIPQAQPTHNNNDIRLILQKSIWYKNLNSKYKIMINQQLAMVSTELKKFHQDTSPTKIFNITFILQNQTLTQILTNLGIYIDDNGLIRQVDSDGDSSDGGGNGNMGPMMSIGLPSISGMDSGLIMPGNNQGGQINMMGLIEAQQMLASGGGGGGGNPMDFLRGPPPGNIQHNQHHQQQQQNPRFGPMNMNNPFNNQPIRFGPDIRPGLLGVAPGIGFNQYDIDPNGMNIMQNDGLLGNPPGSQFNNNNGPNFQQNFFNDPRNRNNNNNMRGGNNFRNGQHCNNNNNNRDRRNFNDNRGGNRDRGRDKI